MTADDVIRTLGLRPHPGEGGWYRETWRAAEVVQTSRGPRSAGTAIWYLLRAGERSAPHRVPFDEAWHWYAGSPVRLRWCAEGGPVVEAVLGPDLAAGQRPQAVVPGGAWQEAALAEGGAYALMGTTLAPGFDFADWEAREEL